MNKIGTCLWFDDQAEQAANLYVSVFKNSQILGVGCGPRTKAPGSLLGRPLAGCGEPQYA